MEERSILVETELFLVGALICAPAQIDIAAGKIKRTDFTEPTYGHVFDQLVSLKDAGKPVDDIQFVLGHLSSCGLIGTDINSVRTDQIAKAAANAVPHNVDWYCHQILRNALLRDQVMMTAKLREKLNESGADPAEINHWILSQVEAMTMREESATKTIYECAKEVVDGLKASTEKKSSVAIPSGLATIDACIGGYVAGELVVIAARPSCGKTSFGVKTLQHNSIRGRRSLMISLEMKGSEIAQRLLCAYTGVNSHAIRSGSIGELDIQAMDGQLKGFMNWKMHVYDKPKATAKQIRAIAKVTQAAHGLDMIMVDYLSLIRAADPRMPRHDQVAANVAEMKALARELNVPMLLLVQMNREAAKEKPRLNHLRESGAIEQDADVAILIDNDPQNTSGQCDLIVAKNRNGTTGTVRVGWDSSKTLFHDL